ncbi:hypothetical protein HK103_007592 [Boothiomyces macroporosus]|uniref:Uncharacterized protein n=1 Tax=Boothiomyces macroporosus TaxID=261099 RepID=A0AAD5Y3W1_9FUNG|nr:hypothetical protein HK103_007592 [Boothiomyces macroporosus]
MATGMIEPEVGNGTLMWYYMYTGNWNSFKKVTNGEFYIPPIKRDEGYDHYEHRHLSAMTRGILFNSQFASSCYKEILPSKYFSTLHNGDQRAIKGAISNRFIMDNNLSFIKENYCIWYPNLPTEKTLKSLFRLKPEMKYLIARACAIGNYSNLYKELKALPEVAVAREAHAAKSKEILDCIGAPEKYYMIMNDYTGGYFYKPETVTNQEAIPFITDYEYHYMLECPGIAQIYVDEEPRTVSDIYLPNQDDFHINPPFGTPDLLGTGFLVVCNLFELLHHFRNNSNIVDDY